MKTRILAITLIVGFSGISHAQNQPAAVNIKTSTDKYIVTLDTTFSSSSSDFAPRYIDKQGNKLVFTSDRGSANGMQNIFYTTQKNEVWTDPSPLIGDNSDNCNYGVVSVDNHRHILFFTRCDIELHMTRKCRLYYSFMNGDMVGEQFPLEIEYNTDTAGDQDYTFGHPYYSNKFNLLVFASDMPGGYGDIDIWVTKYHWLTDSWGKPVNAGPEVNTDTNEYFPFLADDGTLYFTSAGHGGYGGWDIFRASQTGKMSWGNVENMGEPINSDSDDFAIVFKPGTQTGCLSSNRAGGRGRDDIYSFVPVINTAPAVVYQGSDSSENEKGALSQILNKQTCNSHIDSLNITAAKVYPNPNRGEFTYECYSNKKADLTLRIFSSLGKVVHSEQLSLSPGLFSKQFSLQQYGSGIYYVQLLYGCEFIKTVKVIVE